MADVQVTVSSWVGRRGLVLSVVLAMALAAVPLPRLAAAARNPVGSGAGMGSRAPVMLEAGARVAAPGAAVSTVRTPGMPGPADSALAAARTARPAPQPGSWPAHASRLTAYGRLQLEGG